MYCIYKLLYLKKELFSKSIQFYDIHKKKYFTIDFFFVFKE